MWFILINPKWIAVWKYLSFIYISSSNTHIHHRSLSRLDTETLIKSGCLKHPPSSLWFIRYIYYWNLHFLKLFIKVSVSSLESERWCICVLEVSIVPLFLRFCVEILEQFWQCGNILYLNRIEFHIYYLNIVNIVSWLCTFLYLIITSNGLWE
jgi:hypothetical protein